MGGSTGKPDMKKLIAKADRLHSATKAQGKRLDGMIAEAKVISGRLSDKKQAREGRR